MKQYLFISVSRVHKLKVFNIFPVFTQVQRFFCLFFLNLFEKQLMAFVFQKMPSTWLPCGQPYTCHPSLHSHCTQFQAGQHRSQQNLTCCLPHPPSSGISHILSILQHIGKENSSQLITLRFFFLSMHPLMSACYSHFSDTLSSIFSTFLLLLPIGTHSYKQS